MSRAGGIWQVLDELVAAGRFPGYAAAVRIRGQAEVHTGGHMAVEPGSPPMTQDTLFRIASLTKPIGAALAFNLIQDGLLALDDPIARWLPEAANPRVLLAPDGPLDETTPAVRPITVRHLLAMTCGWGVGVRATPLRDAMLERGVHPGPLTPDMSGDEFVARVADLPLAFQPGDGWLYDTGMDVLGVLLARAAGRPLSELMAERVTSPLGLESTAFWTSQIDRLVTAYSPTPDGLEVLDPPDGLFSRPPRFEELSSGLVSTAPDLLRIFCALADGGAPVITGESLRLMTADALTDDQREQTHPIVSAGGSWGLGTAVDIQAAEPWMAPGRWGWTGGTGTSAHVDPSRDTVGVLLTQRAMMGPQDSLDAFWAAVAEAA
jgi:CubicO group peptidase (beta-lactamase class C family)